MVRTVPAALIASVVLVAASGAHASEYDHLVAKHAAAHGVPEALVRRVIQIESKGNSRVVSKGNYGLMQIRLGTARAMGYAGDAQGLLDAETNMTYAVKYLAGAYRVARGNQDQAIRNYQRGYYYQAKAQGLSPYSGGAPVTQQPAAPDPAMVQEAEDRRKALETQRAAAEQQRQAALQSRIEERNRVAAERAAQRETALREHVERQQAAGQRRAAQRQAAIEERAARAEALQRARVAVLESPKQQPQAGVEQEKIQRGQEPERQQSGRQPAERSQAASAQAGSGAAPSRSSRRAEPETAWYNPMRYFNHPAHKAHPYKSVEGVHR